MNGQELKTIIEDLSNINNSMIDISLGEIKILEKARE